MLFLCWRGEDVAVALETDCWWYFVSPQNPNRKKIRSDQLASASHVCGKLCTLDSCWGGFILVLSSHDVYLVQVQCHHNAIFRLSHGEISPVSSWKLKGTYVGETITNRSYRENQYILPSRKQLFLRPYRRVYMINWF